LHHRQRVGIPGYQRVEQIDHDRLVATLSHAKSALRRFPPSPQCSAAAPRR
jgi:hypothetical protein